MYFEKQSTFRQFNHGGILRNQRAGRGRRPLSTKESLHVVFKVDKSKLISRSLRSTKSFNLVQQIIKKYAKRFFVQLEQVSVQNDHCHLLVRTKRRSLFHYFFRVVAGQIAQIFEKEGMLVGVTDTQKDRQIRKQPRLKNAMRTEIASVSEVTKDNSSSATKKENCGTKLWLYRPFSRVIRGYKAYLIVRDYIQLNEKEVLRHIKYNSERLRGLLRKDLERLWS